VAEPVLDERANDQRGALHQICDCLLIGVQLTRDRQNCWTIHALAKRHHNPLSQYGVKN